jgi:Icc protein
MSTAGCLDVADERAARDLEVGHATSGLLRVDVAEGHAAVRSLGPNELALWANAPSLRFRLHTGAASGQWRVSVENALADAQLDVRVAGAPAPALFDDPSRAPTELVFRVELPANADVDLVLQAPGDLVPGGFRFAVFGDVQDAIDRVQDIYAKMNADAAIRFVILVGDLTERGGADELERFRDELKRLRVPCYTTLGNHELGHSPPRYYDYFGRGSSRFTFRGVQFTLLDSASATIAPDVYEWLDAWLDEGRSGLHVVGMHVPPLDPIGARNGAFASRAEANKLLTRLARGGVDLTVYGHVHSYYAYANAGIPAYITGGGGAIPERMDGIGRHYLTFDADPARNELTPSLVRVDR